MTTMAPHCDPLSEIHAANMQEKLLDSCNRINDEQEKLNLLTTLQSKGLVTRDIMSFGVKQASIRTQNRWPDKLTARTGCQLRSLTVIKPCNGRDLTGRRSKTHAWTCWGVRNINSTAWSSRLDEKFTRKIRPLQVGRNLLKKITICRKYKRTYGIAKRQNIKLPRSPLG